MLGRWSPAYATLVAATALVALACTLLPFSRFAAAAAQRARHVALALLATLVTLAACEVALRCFDPIGISYYEWSTRYTLDKVADPELLFHHPPHLRREYGDVRVETNELGLRERPIGARDADERRLLLVGDSVTFGWGVNAEATWGRQLEPLLGEELGCTVRTINSGCGGFDSRQESVLLDRLLGPVTPDGVLLLYVENDVQINRGTFDPWSERALAGKSAPQVMRLLLRRTWLFRLADHVRELHDHGTLQKRVGQRVRPYSEMPGWKTSMASLAAMATACRARSIPFGVCFWRLESNPINEALLGGIREVADRERFPVADVLPWFEGVHPFEIQCSIVDAHPNPRGHARLAERMAPFIVQNGLLPAAR